MFSCFLFNWNNLHASVNKWEGDAVNGNTWEKVVFSPTVEYYPWIVFFTIAFYFALLFTVICTFLSPDSKTTSPMLSSIVYVHMCAFVLRKENHLRVNKDPLVNKLDMRMNNKFLFLWVQQMNEWLRDICLQLFVCFAIVLLAENWTWTLTTHSNHFIIEIVLFYFKSTSKRSILSKHGRKIKRFCDVNFGKKIGNLLHAACYWKWVTLVEQDQSIIYWDYVSYVWDGYHIWWNCFINKENRSFEVNGTHLLSIDYCFFCGINGRILTWTVCGDTHYSRAVLTLSKVANSTPVIQSSDKNKN